MIWLEKLNFGQSDMHINLNNGRIQLKTREVIEHTDFRNQNSAEHSTV